MMARAHTYEHTPDWMACFATAMATMPEMMEAYRMAGEVDYMLHVACLVGVVGSWAEWSCAGRLGNYS